MPNQTRRNFIKTISGSTVALCCGGVGMGILMEGCTTIKQINTTITNNKITVNKTEFEGNKFIILNNDQLQTPIYLNKINEQNYAALLMLCTHKNCDVKPTGSFLTCPCHGSEFDNDGKVLKGPATANLTAYQTQIKETTIIIDINQAIKS